MKKTTTEYMEFTEKTPNNLLGFSPWFSVYSVVAKSIG
jgi:hypothetical protein